MQREHPAWAILHSAVLMCGLCLVLWLNASNFDQTELKALLEFGLIFAGSEVLRRRHAGS